MVSTRSSMILVAFWLLVLKQCLASNLSSSLATYTGDGLGACSTESISSLLPEATFDVESEKFNLSGIIQVLSVTITAPCTTTQESWNKSTTFQYQQSHLSLNKSTGLHTEGGITRPSLLHTNSTSLSTAPSSLVFDTNSAPRVSSTAAANMSTFTGSGTHFEFSDSWFLLMIGLVEMGMA